MNRSCLSSLASELLQRPSPPKCCGSGSVKLNDIDVIVRIIAGCRSTPAGGLQRVWIFGGPIGLPGWQPSLGRQDELPTRWRNGAADTPLHWSRSRPRVDEN